MRDAVVESDGECEIIVGLTRPLKALLMSTCILPRYFIDVYLLWLGCRWLAATPSFGDLLLNAVSWNMNQIESQHGGTAVALHFLIMFSIAWHFVNSGGSRIHPAAERYLVCGRGARPEQESYPEYFDSTLAEEPPQQRSTTRAH